jgi:hypothetical protein
MIGDLQFSFKLPAPNDIGRFDVLFALRPLSNGEYDVMLLSN